MFDDFKELLSIFNAQKVKYLIVGGYAVSFHAQPRATQDIGLLIKPPLLAQRTREKWGTRPVSSTGV
jgi:hypothetical protein